MEIGFDTERKYCILIVEDDAGIAELERRVLQRAGHNVHVASTVDNALRILRVETISAVLLDYHLTDSVGWPVLEAGSAAIPRIPVILVTAQGDENVAAEAVRRGAADYIIKRGDFLDRLEQSVEHTIRFSDAERIVQHLRQLQTAILDSVSAEMVLLNQDGVIILVNESWKRFAKDNNLHLPNYGLGSNYLDFVHEGEISERLAASDIREGLCAVLRGESDSFQLEYPCHAPNRKRWFRMVASPVRLELVKGAVIVHAEITDRVLAEKEKLRKSELVRNILESVDEGIAVVDSAGSTLEWNRAAARITGLSERFEIDTFSEQIDTRKADGVTPCPPEEYPISRALQGEHVQEEEIVLCKRDGSTIYLTVSAAPLFSEHQTIVGAVATFRDSTDRILREREMQRMATALEQTADAVLITDITGRIEYVNPAMSAMSGYSRDELIGNNPRLFKSGETSSQHYQEMWQTLLQGMVWTGHFLNRSKNGKSYHVDATITPIRDEGGAIRQFVSTERNVTRQMELEEQFRQSQKMEAVRHLAGGIAHDFNNLLTVIRGYSEFIQGDLPDDSPLRQDIEHVIHASDSAAGLTRQLLAFGRRQVLKPQCVSPNSVLVDLQKMLRRMIPENIEMLLTLEGELGHINVDVGQFEQIIVNLVVNARDALPNGGKIKLTTSNVDVSEEFADTRLDVVPGAYVRVQLEDTGTGIAPEILPRIFDPFFTTKEVGKGTGLGLSTVHGIVKQSGAYIWAYSEGGHGTVFNLYFPRIFDTAELRKASGVEVRNTDGNEHVLLVEDNPELRDLAARGLCSVGYSVASASNAREALALLASMPEGFALIISDVVLPDVTGPQMVSKAREGGTNLPVIFMTGYTGDSKSLEMAMETGDAFLQKPFTIKTLLETVRQVLDGGQRK